VLSTPVPERWAPPRRAWVTREVRTDVDDGSYRREREQNWS